MGHHLGLNTPNPPSRQIQQNEHEPNLKNKIKQLPEFIATTGIEKIRTAIMEQEALQTAKQKGRSKMAPKMGKIDIDYQVDDDGCCWVRVLSC
jgi:hypothetical protein